MTVVGSVAAVLAVYYIGLMMGYLLGKHT